MNGGTVLDYTGCCSKLEKIASKRIMYGSESNVRLDVKYSRPAVPGENVPLNEAKPKNKVIPFICVGSANKSHHMGINLQTTLSMIKEYPACDGSGHVTDDDDGSGVSRQVSDVRACLARREDATEDGNETFDGTERDPWTVRQTDVADVSQNDRRTTACSCGSRATQNYYKVVTPFVEHVEQNVQPSGTVRNPYAKEKLVKYYELLSKNLLSLKSTMITMNNEFLQLTEKYNRFYRQHVRNGNLTVTLLRTEDELNALKSKIEETVDVYKETVFAMTQLRRPAAYADDRTTVGPPRPRETTGVRLCRVLRRVQCLQVKLRSARIVHGPSGDHRTAKARQ